MTRLTRTLALIASAIASTLALLIVPASAASAAPLNPGSQTPPALSWIELVDSRGINLWNLELSLNRGGITSPDKFFWATITDGCWGLYRGYCALALWFLDWVLSFSWVSTIAAPLLTIGDAMQQVINQIGPVPTFLTITALLAFFLMVRGRTSTALYEVLIACVIAALASGVLAQPVRLVAGPDGLIIQAGQAGQTLAAELATGDAEGQTPEQLRVAQTAALVDTFVRQPTQMINFGEVLDGGRCEAAYNDVVRAGPYGDKSDIRDAVGKCDEKLGDYAGSPSSGMALGAGIVMPAAFVVLLLGLVLGGGVITAGVRALYQAAKSIVTLVTGLLPGGGRGSLMMSVAETVVSLLIIVFVSIFLSIFLMVIQALFASESGGGAARAFVIADIVIVAGLVVYWRQHGRMKDMSGRMAQWLAQRPGGGGPTRMPQRMPGLTAATAMSAVSSMVHLRRRPVPAPQEPARTFIDQRQQLVVIGAVPRGPRQPVDGGHIYPQNPPGPPGPQVPPPDRGDGPLPGGAPQLPGGSRPRLAAGDERAQLGAGNQRDGLPAGAQREALPAGVRGRQGQLPVGPSAQMKRIEAAGKGRKAVGALARAGTNAVLSYATGGTSTVVRGAAKTVNAARTARRVALQAKMVGAAARSRPTAPPRTTAAPVYTEGNAGPAMTGKRTTAPGKAPGRHTATVPRPTPAPPVVAPSRPAAAPPAVVRTAAPRVIEHRPAEPDAAARLRAKLADPNRRAATRRGER
ncbi:hypothetical protein [Cellulosimicrobium cellulans]|uniref:hypothetical protein n=1 Tax=Cellulosimicrobium cellulans TaxID=1710 RepID=UPI0002ECFF7D|nr:hypothetical protein [Cellulosimicrobium cellulans]